MSDYIDSFIQDTMAIRETGALKQYFIDFVGGFGCEHVVYHYLAEGFKKLSRQKGFRIWRFPESFIEVYLSKHAFDFDPLMAEARLRSVPFHWFDIESKPELSADQKEFFADLHEAGFRDGVVVPVYTRPGDIAYFSLGSSEKDIDLSRAQLLQLQAICQHMHLRYNELTETAGAPKLSKREMQVLELIAQGKSNAAMSEELGVSRNTIDTLVRRCFEKLGVSSRVEAALAGVAMGIIIP